MAESDNRALIEIEAFDLITEGLTSLDAYKRNSDKSHLSEAKNSFNEALGKLGEYTPEKAGDAGPLYFRAKYFSAMIGYLDDHTQETPVSFTALKKLIVDGTVSGEISYNAGAAYYSSKSYGEATQRFEAARGNDEASQEVRLLAGAGVALSKAKLATQLANIDDTTDLETAWKQAQAVKVLCRKLRKELFFNFLRRLWGARHVERALSRRANALIKQARKEVKHISRPKKPVAVDTEPPTGTSGVAT